MSQNESAEKLSMDNALGMEDRTPDENLLYIRQVGDYKITPLSFGQLAIVMPYASKLVEVIKPQLPASLDQLSPQLVIEILMRNLGELIPIIAIYVNAPEEEIKNLPAEIGVRLAFEIWVANARTFMDFFVLGSQLGPR